MKLISFFLFCTVLYKHRNYLHRNSENFNGEEDHRNKKKVNLRRKLFQQKKKRNKNTIKYLVHFVITFISLKFLCVKYIS